MARERRQATRRRRTSGGAIRRLLGVLAFLPVAGRVPTYARLLWSLVLDDRTPTAHKAVLGAAVGYLFLGRDLIPDDLPLVGGLEDLVVVTLAIEIFLDGVPEDVLDEKLEELGIDRIAFDRDIAQIRRLTPGPVRRTIRRIPGAIDGAAAAWRRADPGPRVRAWINKEGSLA